MTHLGSTEQGTVSAVPAAMKLWDRAKNLPVRATDVRRRSERVCFWRCKKGPDHAWRAAPAYMGKFGCPFCGGKRISVSNTLRRRYPKIAAEWHPTKNGSLTPENVTFGSARRAWWKCERGPDHEWQAVILQRTRVGTACPFCSGKKLSMTNCLAAVEPKLAREWHPSLNGALRPEDVTSGMAKTVYWQCKKGHVWRTKLEARTGKGRRGCPRCAHRMVSSRPDVMKFWDHERNRLDPDDVSIGDSRVIYFRCPRGPDHLWRQSPRDRRLAKQKVRCPYCSGRRAAALDCLERARPDLALEWHPTKNGALRPTDVRPGSSRRVRWRCRADPRHEWTATVATRTGMGTGCPYCAGRHQGTLAARRPTLALEWHPTKNGALRPEDVSVATHRHVWWKCPKGPDHEWRAMVRQRTKVGQGCPFCSGRAVSITNCLLTLEPAIARQWHPTKNGKLTPRQVTRGSDRRVWWQCAMGHGWPACIYQRTGSARSGCPICRPQKRKVVTTRRSNIRS